jgi:hypothetical protein
VTCLLCGSSAISITGVYISQAGEVLSVYHLCGGCWGLGPAAIGPMAEAALSGDRVTMN